MESIYWTQLITIAIVHLLAVMSPGPDLIMITRNALIHSRRAGIYTALGLALGIVVHVTYSLIGIGLLIAQSVVLFTIVKYIGAAYLIYIAYKCLSSKKSQWSDLEMNQQPQDISALSAMRIGFLTNVLNPKATLFFLAVFTQVINPATPIGFQLLYGAEMALVTFLWFALIAFVLSYGNVRSRFHSAQYYLEKVFGIILVGLSLKIALSSSK